MTTSMLVNSKQPAALAAFRGGAFDLRLLTGAAERRACFALRLRAYAKYLLAAEMPPDGEYKDRFDDLPTTLLIGAYDGERLVGSMRLCFSRPWEDLSSLPCAAYYPDLVPVKSQGHGALMEVSRVAIDPAITNTSFRTTLYASLVRVGLIAAEAGDVSTILIATPAESEKFYRYMLGFQRIGEPAAYPPGDFRISLLGGAMAQARQRQGIQNSFFRISAEEVVRMRAALTSRALVRAVA